MCHSMVTEIGCFSALTCVLLSQISCPQCDIHVSQFNYMKGRQFVKIISRHPMFPPLTHVIDLWYLGLKGCIGLDMSLNMQGQSI